MKVKICGITHEVEEVVNRFDASAFQYGQINYGEAKILVNKDMPQELKNETLCHEIVHGILVHIGRNDLTEDESLVQSLGNAIAQSFTIKWEDEDGKEEKA